MGRSSAPWGRRRAALLALLGCAAVALAPAARASSELVRTVAKVRQSVVGVGTFERTRSPATVFSGTGFVVGDGLSVITNAHVVPDRMDAAHMEQLGVVVGNGDAISFRPARLAGLDTEHDLAHLRLSGEPLPALALGDAGAAAEGMDLAFTGYPLGMVLGLHPVTHHALLSAITPVVMPSLSARRLDAHALAQLQRSSFAIFQLDGTAYPGNSGSPVYDPATGTVLAVVNMVMVKGLKETAITNPSGITYAVPVNYVHDLLQRK